MNMVLLGTFSWSSSFLAGGAAERQRTKPQNAPGGYGRDGLATDGFGDEEYAPGARFHSDAFLEKGLAPRIVLATVSGCRGEDARRAFVHWWKRR
jgi:hypothetical protein